MKIRLNRGPLRWWLIALGLLFAQPALGPALVGVGLMVLGGALHLWAKGCLNQNRQLTVAGPYRWSRNPFYVANLLIDLGLALFINVWILTAGFLIVWALVYRRQIRLEESTLEGIYGQAWHDYRSRVPVFLPCRRPYRDVPADQGFSWRNPNLAQSREIPRLVRTVSYPLLLLVAYMIRPADWFGGQADPGWLLTLPGLSCLAGAAALQAFGAVLSRQLRERRPVMPAILHTAGMQAVVGAVYLLILLVFTGAELEADRIAMPIGAGILLIGFCAVRRRTAGNALLSDCLTWSGALGGASFLAEVPWLGILAVATALAIRIDIHVRRANLCIFPSFGSPAESAAGLGLTLRYAAFAAASVLLALGKEAILDGPNAS